MHYVAGDVLTPDGFIGGYVGFEDGRVEEVERGEPPHCLARGVVIPTTINCHTHCADYIVPVDLSLRLEEIVAPPSGLKHRMLNKAEPHRIVEALEYLSGYMASRGTSRFIDFREGGAKGASLLSRVRGGASPEIMGRPSSLGFDEGELRSILSISRGIGVSSVTDWDQDRLRRVADLTHRSSRLFGLHASERIREDIDQVLDLEPDFLVHMNQATDDDLALCAQEEVPVVVCPRSNLFFQRLPPLARMLEAGVEIGLGTDNAMISLPDMIGEMETAGRILRYQGVQKVDSVLEMGISTGRKILKVNEIIGIQPGSWCDFMVVRPKGGEVMTDIVLRSGADDPRLVCIGNNTWRGPGCACSKEY